MVLFAGFDINLAQWALALGFFIGSILLAEFIVVFIDKLIRPLLAKTKTQLDDFLFENLRGPLKLFFSIGGAYLGLQIVTPGLTVFGRNLDGLLFLALIVAVAHAVARTLNAVMKWYLVEVGAEKARVGDIFPIVRKLIMAAVYFAGLAILLSELGVEIGPLIAGLGVAGLAVALALQDSLKNFFAGIYLLSDKPIQRGDIIALDNDKSDVKGTVEEIGWRSTRIKGVANAIHIIPNEKLAASVIVNYSKGRETRTVMVKVGIEYGEDVDKALKSLMQAAQEAVKSSPAADAGVEPEVRVNEFLDSAVELAALVRVKDYGERFAVASSLRRNILRIFRKQGIHIPFPIRTLHMAPADGKPIRKPARRK
ncbi:mechanosensitive ion channel family protein [Candidatus Micrarchaeota archaeon]|nr:mechanosensitive ion channel family protein [Candidatus Micrarchaeota archaeon]